MADAPVPSVLVPFTTGGSVTRVAHVEGAADQYSADEGLTAALVGGRPRYRAHVQRVNTIADLESALVAGTHASCIVCLDPYRGGTFNIVAKGSHVSDGGCTFTGGSLAALRVFRGVVKFAWYGPAEGGVTACDVQLQAACDKVNALYRAITGLGGNTMPIYSWSAVDLGWGVYRLTTGVTISGRSVGLFSDEGAILLADVGSTITHITFQSTQDNWVHGVQFVRGAHAVDFQNASFTCGNPRLVDCTFTSLTGIAVVSVYTGGGSCPLILSARNCRWNNCTGCLQSVFDRTFISDSWVWTPATVGGVQTHTPAAQFVNTSGLLYLDRVMGVGLLNTAIDTGMRWIDNHSWGVYVRSSSFSGDGATAGIPLIYQHADLMPTAAPWLNGVEIHVIDSFVACGGYNQADGGYLHIPSGGAVPMRVSFRGTSGAIGAMITGPDIATTLAAHLAAYPNTARFIHYDLPHNTSCAGSLAAIPPCLVPYCDPETAAILPTFSLPALLSGSTGAMYVGVNLPAAFRGGVFDLYLSWTPDVANTPLERLISHYEIKIHQIEIANVTYDFVTSPDYATQQLPTLVSGPDVLTSIHYSTTAQAFRQTTGPAVGILTILWNSGAGTLPANPQCSLIAKHLTV